MVHHSIRCPLGGSGNHSSFSSSIHKYVLRTAGGHLGGPGGKRLTQFARSCFFITLLLRAVDRGCLPQQIQEAAWFERHTRETERGVYQTVPTGDLCDECGRLCEAWPAVSPTEVCKSLPFIWAPGLQVIFHWELQLGRKSVSPDFQPIGS